MMKKSLGNLFKMVAATMAAALVFGACAPAAAPPASAEEKPAGDASSAETAALPEGNGKPLEIWSFLSQEEMNTYKGIYEGMFPDKKVKMTVFPSAQYQTKLQNAFRSGAGCPDVIYFEIAQLGAFKESGFLEDLNNAEYGGADLTKDQYSYVADLSKNSKGELSGISWQATPGGFWYKKALAKEYLGTDDPAELSKITASWDSIIEAGKGVSEKSGGKVSFFSGMGDINTVVNNTKGMPWVDAEGNMVSDEILLKNFTLFKDIRDNKCDAKLDSWSAPWADGMYKSSPFIFIGQPTWGLHYVIKANTPKDKYDAAKDTWGLVPAPAAYQAGGTWISMYSKSENKADAWNYIKNMTTNMDYLEKELIGKMGDFPGYIPAVEKAIADGHTDPFTGTQSTFTYFDEIAKKVKNDGMTKYDTKAGDTLTAKQNLMLDGKLTPEQAVAEWKKDMKNAFPEIK